MKSLLCLLLLAIPIHASDTLGIYFDTDATLTETTTSTPFELVDGYVVITESSISTGVSGWEVAFEFIGEPIAPAWVLEGPALNVGVAPSFSVGIGTGALALPVVDGAVLLATVSFYVESPGDEIEIWMGPINNPSMLDPPVWGNHVLAPIYVAGHDATLFTELHWLSGCENEPIAIVNNNFSSTTGALELSGDFLSFAGVMPGEAAELSTTARNYSEISLIGQLNLDGSCYTWRFPDGPFYTSGDIELNPGQQTEIIVRFEPQEVIEYTSELILETCGNNSVLICTNSSSDPLQMVAPNGGEIYEVGQQIQIQWSGGFVGNSIKLEAQYDYNGSWETVVNSCPNSGSYYWNIPDHPSEYCKIKVSTTGGTQSDISDNFFTIAGDWVRVSAPDGGEFIGIGCEYPIQWYTNSYNNIDIDLSRDGGLSWESIVENYNAISNRYLWTSDGTPSNNCKIRVGLTGSFVSDMSDENFELGIPQIEIVAPSDGDRWFVGCPYDLQMIGLGFNEVEVELSTDAGATWSHYNTISFPYNFPFNMQEEHVGQCVFRVNACGVIAESGLFTVEMEPSAENFTASDGLLTGIQLNWEYSDIEQPESFAIRRDGYGIASGIPGTTREYFDSECSAGEHVYEILPIVGCNFNYVSTFASGYREFNSLGEIESCSATDNDFEVVIVSWDYENPGHLGFKIWRDDNLVYQESDPNQSQWIDTDCVVGQQYDYRISAWNNEDESESCNCSGYLYSTEIIIDYPSQNSYLSTGHTATIRWRTVESANIEQVDIVLFRTVQGISEELFIQTPNDGQQEWVVTEPESWSCLMTIRDSANHEIFVNSGIFSIEDNSQVNLEPIDEPEPESLPERFELGGCVPNPFNPKTTISYNVPQNGGMVSVIIYDISGKMVRQLVHQFKTAGSYDVSWNGKNNIGRKMPTGVYFCRMVAPGYAQSMKLTLVQ
jgi:hypothetical protein